MIYMIICALICGFIMITEAEDKLISKILKFLLGALTGICVGLLILLTVGQIIGCFLPCQYVVTGTTNIVALNNSSGIDGSFFLGCGTIDNKTVYKYIVDTNNGKQIREIKDDDGITFYIKECSEEPRIEYKSWNFINQSSFWYACPSMFKKEVITFYVPEGSVTNKFNIDLN